MSNGTTTALGGSTSIDSDLLRERVTLFLKVMFLLDITFYAVSGTMRLLGLSPHVDAIPVLTLMVRWSITALLLGGWLVASRLSLSRGTLVAMESGGVLALAWLYAQLASDLQQHGPWLTLSMISLALVLRAAIVPSPTLRTALVGLTAMAISLGLAMHLHPTERLTGLVVAVMGSAWVAVTAVTSRIIYGLRRQVTAAKRLGQYELGRKLGEGGMGAVYEAKHVLLRRPTALKLLPVDKIGETTVARFEREVQETSCLEHPNSVNIYDYGRTPDGQFYYVMEYLDGLGLNEVLEMTGPLEPARVVAILSQAARALAEAHAKGLVHRDVKPSNIMLCNRGLVPDTVKVLDFGLVKTPDDASDKVTMENTIMGTPHYLAPEAINAPDEVGPPADVYALGAVGYLLLTGCDVFDGKTVIEICSKHLSDMPTPPSQIAGEPLVPELEALIMRCLAKDPAKRFADGRALAQALEALPLPAWSESEAMRWWNAHAASRRPASPAAEPPERLTVAAAYTKAYA